jgi:Tfp pilus assembly protein PilF
MAIHGPLRELGIHDVFQLLDLSRKTGVLRVRSELRQNEGTIWFEAGAVVAASIRSNPHRIGDILLRAGKIRPEDLVRARETQREGDRRRMGEILVQIGALSQRELETQVRAQVEEVVFTVLNWSEGHFTFEEGQPSAFPREAAIRISTEALLMEGARRIDEWSRIQDRVPHLGMVPRLATPTSEEAGSLQLTPFEWRVLAACDGVLDVRAIASSLAGSDFDVARTLFGLDAAGIIALADPATMTAAAAPREDPTALLSQAESFLRRGDPAAARTVAESVVAAFPDDARGHLVLGRCHLAGQRFAEAEPALAQAARLQPDLAVAIRLLAQARVGLARFDEARQSLEQWLSLPGRPGDEDRHLHSITRLHEAVGVLAEHLKVAP